MFSDNIIYTFINKKVVDVNKILNT